LTYIIFSLQFHSTIFSPIFYMYNITLQIIYIYINK
ncbi:hypothetical protein, partial [Plasmodium yoelii yoelii]